MFNRTGDAPLTTIFSTILWMTTPKVSPSERMDVHKLHNHAFFYPIRRRLVESNLDGEDVDMREKSRTRVVH